MGFELLIFFVIGTLVTGYMLSVKALSEKEDQ